jgi:hypothetical protein
MGFSLIAINEPTTRFSILFGFVLMGASIRFFSSRVAFMRLTLFDNPIFLPGGGFATLILATWGLTGTGITHRGALGINDGCSEDHYQPCDADGQSDSGRNCMQRYLSGY